MKTPLFVFAVLVGLCAVLVITFATPELPYEEVLLDDGTTARVGRATGVTHPQFPTLRQGGAGAERHATTLWLGWAFVLLQVLFFGGCLALGMERRGKLGPARGPLLLGSLILAGIFTALIFSYRSYMLGESQGFFLSLPRPTAWMMYAVWTFPVVFILLYIGLFDRWFFTEEDERRLSEIVAKQRERAAREA